jgi:hypothetical protein
MNIEEEGGDLTTKVKRAKNTENLYITFILSLLILLGLLLMIVAVEALTKATDNIWDDIAWSVLQYLVGEAVIFVVPIPFAGGLGIGLTAGGSIFLIERNRKRSKK